MSKVAILILAAGASRRMGTVKQLLPYKETTLLGWAIEQAKASEASEMFCVLGANADRIQNQLGDPLPWIVNHQHKQGLSSSIAKGVLALADRDALMIILADQPGVKTEDLNRLIKLARTHPDRIVASNYNGSKGVPAIFPKKYFSDLLDLKGDKGAKVYLNQHKDEILVVDSLLLADIDTQEDYKKLKEG